MPGCLSPIARKVRLLHIPVFPCAFFQPDILFFSTSHTNTGKLYSISTQIFI